MQMTCLLSSRHSKFSIKIFQISTEKNEKKKGAISMNHLTLATNVLSVQSLITVQKYKNYHY